VATVEQVRVRVEEIIRATLKLGSDVELNPDSDLVKEIGLDSIEAFESVALLHEMLGVRIPEDLDPKAMGTISNLSAYIVSKYDAAKVDAFLAIDVAARLASMHEGGELA
jgi:acyl carrier protein